MFWKRRRNEAPEEHMKESAVPDPQPAPIEIRRGAQRPVTILRIAGELERRGKKVVELFKEVRSPLGQAVLPIHFREGGEDVFVEVETGSWEASAVGRMIRAAAVLRNSEYPGAGLKLFSADPAPREVAFFLGRSPAALFQLDLVEENSGPPETLADRFKRAAGRHWGVELDYETGGLPLVEELLTAALGVDENERPPTLDVLAQGLGCYLGEVIRRNAGESGSWDTASDWGDGPILEFRSLGVDPTGKARAFLRGGTEDSVTYYADYVLNEIGGAPGRYRGQA